MAPKYPDAMPKYPEVTYPSKTKDFKFYGLALIIAAFVVLCLTVFFGSWFTVNQTERGVLLRNGAFVAVVQPGLHFKAPWIEDVYKIDTTTKNFHWDNINSYSADQQPADLKVSVTLHVAPDKIAEMYARFAGNVQSAVDRLILPHINQQVKVVFGQYTAAKAITNRGQLNADVVKALTDSLSYDPVFTIEGVQIENITFSPDYIRSVEQRMQAEVEVQKLQQNLAREKVQAEITVTQATAKANSVRAEAQAQADAIRLKGEAEAAAISARGKALNENPNVIQLTQAERWNGSLHQTMIPGSSVPFISVK
jgi:regulator of protease activity HflC (stomatin/prohibitin superfamily)